MSNTDLLLHTNELESQARNILAEEYERGGRDGAYPSYAEQARTGAGTFTMCSIRAVMRALAIAHQRPADHEITPEMVKAVKNSRCTSCGAFPFDDCKRHPQRDCHREFCGGSRKAPAEALNTGADA